MVFWCFQGIQQWNIALKWVHLILWWGQYFVKRARRKSVWACNILSNLPFRMFFNAVQKNRFEDILWSKGQRPRIWRSLSMEKYRWGKLTVSIWRTLTILRHTREVKRHYNLSDWMVWSINVNSWYGERCMWPLVTAL